MKKHKFAAIFAIVIAFALIFAACNKNSQSNNTEQLLPPDDNLPTASDNQAGADIAYIYTHGQKDTAFSQEIYSTVKYFSDEEGISWSPYLIEQDDDEAAKSTFELAAKNGAKLIILHGDEMAEYMRQTQSKNPELQFIVLDASLMPKQGALVEFDMGQAGYIAGYSALGEKAESVFILGSELKTPVSAGFVNGALLGAEAAEKKNKRERDEEYTFGILNFNEESTLSEKQAFTKKAADKTDAYILACGKEEQLLAIDLAKNASNIKIIGIDGSISFNNSKSIAGLIKKTPRGILYTCLVEWQNGEYDENAVKHIAGVKEDAFSLEKGEDFFSNLTDEKLDELVQSFARGVLADKLAAYTRSEYGRLPLDIFELPVRYDGTVIEFFMDEQNDKDDSEEQ